MKTLTLGMLQTGFDRAHQTGCCVDSCRRCLPSRSKHLAEIAWIAESLHQHEIATRRFLCYVANFIRLGLFWQIFSFPPPFFFFKHNHIYLASLNRLPLETRLSLWGLWIRFIIESTLTGRLVSCGTRTHTHKHVYSPKHKHRTSYSALATYLYRY